MWTSSSACCAPSSRLVRVRARVRVRVRIRVRARVPTQVPTLTLALTQAPAPQLGVRRAQPRHLLGARLAWLGLGLGLGCGCRASPG